MQVDLASSRVPARLIFALFFSLANGACAAAEEAGTSEDNLDSLQFRDIDLTAPEKARIGTFLFLEQNDDGWFAKSISSTFQCGDGNVTASACRINGVEFSKALEPHKSDLLDGIRDNTAVFLGIVRTGGTSANLDATTKTLEVTHWMKFVGTKPPPTGASLRITNDATSKNRTSLHFPIVKDGAVGLSGIGAAPQPWAEWLLPIDWSFLPGMLARGEVGAFTFEYEWGRRSYNDSVTTPFLHRVHLIHTYKVVGAFELPGQ